MPLRTTARRALSVALAGLVGLVTTLVAASPAAAEPRAVNDGATECLVNGAYAFYYHITNDLDVAIRLTSVIGTPPLDPDYPDELTGTEIGPFDNILVAHIVPPGTTAAGFTATWESVGDSSVTGTINATAIQQFPACEPQVSAEVTPDCEPTATVTLVNTGEAAATFVVGDTEHEVAGQSTTTLEDVPTTSGKLTVDVIDDF